MLRHAVDLPVIQSKLAASSYPDSAACIKDIQTLLSASARLTPLIDVCLLMALQRTH